MTIGYWSEKSGMGVTYNMIATALSMSALSDRRFILMQGKHDNNRVDYAFTPYMEENMMKEDFGYYDYCGIDTIINKLENNILNIDDIMREIVRVKNSNLYYLPATRMNNKHVFDRRFLRVSEGYIERLRALRDGTVVLLELNSGLENISGNILNCIDLLVINIVQENNALGRIRDNMAVMEKSLFIVGKYDDKSEFNIRNIYRRYHIDETAIGAVPYNVKFKDSVCLGRCREFFERNTRVRRENENYTFMKYLGSTAEMIMKRCLIERL